MWLSFQVDIETFLLLYIWYFSSFRRLERFKSSCVCLYSQNIVKHENLKYSDNLVRKIVLRYWKLLNYAVCEPLCQWSQLTQEERGEEESSIFKTAKIKKLQKYCKIYETFKIFSTWYFCFYFCFQKYCTILNTLELFRMWTALPVIPTYTRGGRGERGGSELHNSVWYSCTILQYQKLFNYSACELLLQWSQLTQEEIEGREESQSFIIPQNCSTTSQKQAPLLKQFFWKLGCECINIWNI